MPFNFRWIPFWAYSFFVFQSAVLPPREIPGFLLRINDKFIHGVQYFLLALLAVYTFSKAKTLFLQKKAFLLALIYGSVFGAVTEFTQLYVPGRSCDIKDWLADFAGVCLGLGLAKTVGKNL